MKDRIVKSLEEWRAELSDEEFQICRLSGTEPPFSGRYCSHHEAGEYCCRCCGTPLFSSREKYDSHCGWPSFTAPWSEENLEYLEDSSHGMRRIEVRCRMCDAHLGHVFPDGPPPGGRRYCINSLSLSFSPRKAVGEAQSDPGSR